MRASSHRLSISLLDLGIVAPGQDGAQVLQQTLRLAQLADRLGYDRLWLSEHHEAHFCWTGPEVVLATLARTTSRIGLGSAAVLLPLYSPLAVAETYRTLAALSDGRVALGVCAGVPADPVALAALMESGIDAGSASRLFADKLAELVRYLDGDFAPGHRFARGATPCFAEAPPLWLMGSGARSAEMAAAAGAGYAFSLFHRASTQDAAIPRAYRDRAQGRDGAQLAVALSCVCADTDAAAQAQRAQVESWIGGTMRVNIAGTPQACHQQILAACEKHGAQAAIVYQMWHLEERRRDALVALAELFALPAAGADHG
ncbi:MsnO8 family LLM class oxidoreductase [Caenimonas terrae]|uniref:MsnO8 family LLM class oxidoreductase n=1 Tax=Caenimonas terrae TaxID=696074 RepID=A0ABW0NC28_9BURK